MLEKLCGHQPLLPANLRAQIRVGLFIKLVEKREEAGEGVGQRDQVFEWVLLCVGVGVGVRVRVPACACAREL